VLLIWVKSALQAASSDRCPVMEASESRLLRADLERLALELRSDPGEM